MADQPKSNHVKRKGKKGEVIKSVIPWKCFPLFFTSPEEDQILQNLPLFDTNKHNPLKAATDVRQQSIIPPPPPQVEKLLKRASAARQNTGYSNPWSIYTIVTAIYIALLGIMPTEQPESSTVNHNNIAINKNDDEDDDEELSCDAWTWIQDHISWTDWKLLHRQVKEQLILVSAPHPLLTYATQTVPFLTRDQVTQAVHLLKLQSKFHSGTIDRASSSSSGTMAMRLSQILKDAHGTRNFFAILLAPIYHAPTNGSSSTTIHNANNWTGIRHSCLPEATLELESPTKANLVALYDHDLDVSGDLNNSITICTVPLDHGPMEREARRRCCRLPDIDDSLLFWDSDTRPCLLCRHDTKQSTCPLVMSSRQSTNTGKDPSITCTWKESVRLGHYYFQEERYSDAKACYQAALATNTSDNDDMQNDIRHALGALQLAQGKFLDAQLSWKNAAAEVDASIDAHGGIQLQLQKQQAYRYFSPSPQQQQQSSLAKKKTQEYNYHSHFDDQCFVTPMLKATTCQELIDIATRNGQWTTGRHYAVPTNDIPVHKIQGLLDWFVPWMEEQCAPLMMKQFRLLPKKGKEQRQRFYVHDAFFVRYQGKSSSSADDSSHPITNNHLPCHLDECTHSAVICLNDDFEGGGTYFHDYDTVLSPSVGEVVTFKGDSLRHGGDAVVKGTRYILAVFLYLDRTYDPGNEVTPAAAAAKSNGSGEPSGPKHQVQAVFREAKKQKTGFSFGFDMG
ncbi:Procollagen-lysine 2-oxoglutarate 5-dioxygenase [Seminavis robusta]|uniref:Procollagen-lysine 2-oxoglutarate 5-dioxygenase n=1 Tax=Seminavis robusta TaxID=568900 RepID=A0A9N8I178_9STRA|nr:Procollagen-lysine 2-oxoglutarate 5-dioxygenase [Seminavis robusta]|eukprot:Sro3220_g345490.1 Procollagen-lysine 2-oxoglutarate 5-dioxygenase (736) ;mRNA; r:5425-7632